MLELESEAVANFHIASDKIYENTDIDLIISGSTPKVILFLY